MRNKKNRAHISLDMLLNLILVKQRVLTYLSIEGVLILALGENINERDLYGKKPVEIAIGKGHSSTVQTLLVNNVTECNPYTQLVGIALRSRNFSIIKLLLINWSLDTAKKLYTNLDSFFSIRQDNNVLESHATRPSQ